MYAIGEAIRQRLGDGRPVHHVAVEEFVSPEVVREDLERYKFISNNFPVLLHLVYKVPLFYYRKYLREKLFNAADLRRLSEKIEALGAKTVICVSHRPAFWVSNLKRREGVDLSVWGVLGEYGKNLGWKYLFWEQMNGFLSPVGRNALGFAPPRHVRFININLPARREYHELSSVEGDIDSVLLVCGFWGQGPIAATVKNLSGALPDLKIHAVCGENKKAYEQTRHLFKDNDRIRVYGVTPSLAPSLRECASVITKPGISTLLESHAAGRKIFLLKGMPVAEDNNARFAVEHFGAQWFDVETFKSWYMGQKGRSLS
ncbi:MAG TPA: hypothetical protein VGX48_18825 [Pyrinomonadaceae bacterium]|nr:hypothetical protein [Pyrinomonadaceae bacterium]